MTDRELDDRILGSANTPAPPPSPALLNAVGSMQPVRTRTRFGAFLAVAVIGLIGPAIAFWQRPLRRDLGGLPVAWVVIAAGVWSAAFAFSLFTALVPRRGDVLPAPGRASRAATMALAGLLVFTLFASFEAPGLSMSPAERNWTFVDACLHCVGFTFKIALLFLVAGLVALRRLVPVGRPRIGLALGAAGGAMAGLTLHFLCPFAGTAHVVLSHVGGTAISAVAGAALVWLALRR
jgi:hypothetical protein